MNIYKPTKKIGTWPQMVISLTKERDQLIKENKELTEENLELKRRCCELWKDVMEEKSKSDL
tara:strand:+ start:285 stop:470 length:186 start_codon:yes stop_codon:yes gene_type:complete